MGHLWIDQSIRGLWIIQYVSVLLKGKMRIAQVMRGIPGIFMVRIATPCAGQKKGLNKWIHF